MARIEGTPARGIFQRMVYWMTRRMLGSVPEPMRIAAWSPRAFRGRMDMERRLMKLSIPPDLVAIAQLRTAQRIGCPF
jgi:alkylhydroperoxidase family enzyme